MTICYPPSTDWSCYGDEATVSRLDPSIRQRSEALAWYTLASLTAWRIGVCPTTIRPCAARCAYHGSWIAAPVSSAYVSALPLQTIGGIYTPYVTGGQWVNSCGCAGPDDCSCTSLSEVILPGPVGGIESIEIDGIVLPPESYRVDNGDRLVRLDGAAWPLCQDMGAPAPASYEPLTGVGPAGTIVFTRVGQQVTVEVIPSDQPNVVTGGVTPWAPLGVIIMHYPTVSRTMLSIDADGAFNVQNYATPSGPFTITYETSAPAVLPTGEGTFEVTYYRGAAPNEMTRYAAGVLAAEFYKACTNAKCRLPRGVTSVVRQGVTVELRTNIWEGGMTGIPEVDTVINIYNPNHLKQAPRVVTPETRRRARTTTWGVR